MVLVEADRHRPVDVRAGDMWIRVAESAAEIAASQSLRYRVFCQEMAAEPTVEMAAARREFDAFDEICDHLLVFDCSRGRGPEAVVGTYRLLRREPAAPRGRFYTSDEYDISRILAYRGEVLELGRSCVDSAYRSGSTMHLLWRGIAEYVLYYDICLLFGCASLSGIVPEDLALELSYLHHHHLAPPALRPKALPERYVDMNMMPQDAIDPRLAISKLPPLIKGYLRLGGFVGDGAVVDRAFGTTDVCIVVKTDWVTEKYFRHYVRGSSQYPEGFV